MIQVKHVKVIYSERAKFTLDDAVLGLIDKAVEKVEELSKEEEWHPSFEIYVPHSRYAEAYFERKGSYPTGQVIIKIKGDSDVDDSFIESQKRFLAGQEPQGGVKVDLGEYDHEGWSSLIYQDDLRSIPHPYFTMMFMYGILEPSKTINPLPNIKEVEEDHWLALAQKIHGEAEERIVKYERKDSPRFLDRANNLLKLSKNFLDNQNLEPLKQALYEIPE